MPTFEKIAPPAPRANWRKQPKFWLPCRLWELDDWLSRGKSDREIGQHFGKSANSIRTVRGRCGLESRRHRLFSARQVAMRLGVLCSKTVAHWIAKGWMRGRRGQSCGLHCQWYVTEKALFAFLETPAHWHRWEPSRIPDKALREWCIELRAGVRFLTTGQVAARYSVGHPTVHAWIANGVLPAVRHQNWMICENDLVGFVPPYERSKQGQRQRRWTATEDMQLCARRAEGQTGAQIAKRLGRTIGAISNRWYRLTGAQAKERAA